MQVYHFQFNLKYLRNILMPIHHPVNLHILFSNLIQHNIIPTNHIFIIRPEADPFSKISSHIVKLLYILNSSIYLLNSLYCHFFIVFRNILFNVLHVLCHNRVNPQFHHRLYPDRFLQFIQTHPGAFILNCFFCFL